MWQHEGSCGVRHESVDIDGAGVVDMLYHPLAGIGVADFDSCSRQRNDFAGFGVFLFKADERGKGGVIENEIIGFTVLGNEHGEVRDKFLSFCAFGLMHHIQAIRKIL